MNKLFWTVALFLTGATITITQNLWLSQMLGVVLMMLGGLVMFFSNNATDGEFKDFIEMYKLSKEQNKATSGIIVPHPKDNTKNPKVPNPVSNRLQPCASSIQPRMSTKHL
jgi:uncharacterized membrane protein